MSVWFPVCFKMNINRLLVILKNLYILCDITCEMKLSPYISTNKRHSHQQFLNVRCEWELPAEVRRSHSFIVTTSTFQEVNEEMYLQLAQDGQRGAVTLLSYSCLEIIMRRSLRAEALVHGRWVRHGETGSSAFSFSCIGRGSGSPWC